MTCEQNCASSWSALRCCHWSYRALVLTVFSCTMHPEVWGFSPWHGVYTKLKCPSSPLQLAIQKTLNLRNTLHSNEHLGDHQELEQGWGDASEGPGRAGPGRAVKESRCCSWSEPCRAGLLGMEGGTKCKWMVGEQLSSTCNSKATQEALAVWMCKGETAQVKQLRKTV